MLKKIWRFLATLKDKLPLTYSILLIILVPLTLIINTWWNLRSFERDMHYAVRDQALAIQQMFMALTQDQQLTPELYGQTLSQIQTIVTSLVEASIIIPDQNNQFQIMAATNLDSAQRELDLFIYPLVWSHGETYLTKMYHPETNQNVWMVIDTLTDAQGQKQALVNFKVSTKPVDIVINRTTRDALIILAISVAVVILLLVNHLRFFEQSIMFAKLKELDQMKDDFISVATHELKTPLTAIKSAISMFEEEQSSQVSPKARKWLDISQQGISRLEDLVRDLLNVSRIEQGRLDFTLAAVNSTELVNDVIKQLTAPAEAKGLQLIHETPENLLPVLSHADRLREVLVNLIGNAIKYTLQGQVIVKQQLDDQNIKILVQDTGVGIAPEDKEKLFQKFSRIKTDQTREIPGTGLGLWITQSLIERMQGNIYVDSIVGQGTVFTVVLKVAPEKTPDQDRKEGGKGDSGLGSEVSEGLGG